MKKALIIIVNVIIIAAILVFVVLYSGYENGDSYHRQIEHFENTTITMEQVTEATAYIRNSHVLENTSAHLILLDTLDGLSTRPKLGTDAEYEVSYGRMALLDDVGWINEIGKSINITRAYTNPMNGEQSLAFCNNITLHDPESGTPKAAVLLRAGKCGTVHDRCQRRLHT